MTEYPRSTNTKAVGSYAVYRARITENYRQSINLLRKVRTKRSELKVASSKHYVKSEAEKETMKLEQVVKESEDVLAEAASVFPFTLFRTLICLDRHKLTIKKGAFLGSGQIISLPIENIKNVQANIGPIFGSLTITSGSLTISSEHFVNNTQDINYLWRKDAEKIHKILQGAIVAKTESVDISKIPSSQLKKQLPQLGEGIS
jgi:hypothetical protein